MVVVFFVFWAKQEQYQKKLIQFLPAEWHIEKGVA
jgi:hypothetical protein